MTTTMQSDLVAGARCAALRDRHFLQQCSIRHRPYAWKRGLFMITILGLIAVFDGGAAERGERRRERREGPRSERREGSTRDQKPDSKPATSSKSALDAPNGTWKWTVQTDNGQSFELSAKLKWADGQLTGSHIGRNGSEVAISDGTFDGEQIGFKVIRERDGQPSVSWYRGNLAGNNITGKIETTWKGDTRTREWLAHWQSPRPDRSSNGINDTWVWTFQLRGGVVESKARLKADGEKLTGIVTGRGRELPIEHGTFKDGEVRFDVTSEFGGRAFTTTYKAKLQGNKLTGTTEFEDREGKVQTRDWEAERFDDSIVRVVGSWQWTVTANGQTLEPFVRLKQEADKVTGRLIWGEHEIEITEGKAGAEELSFTVSRERDGRKFVSKYRGKVSGDTIKGKVDSDLDGVAKAEDWSAKRVGR